MTGPGVRMPSAREDQDGLREAIRRRLTDTRETTLDLLQALVDEQLYGQPEPVMGVLAWDVGHVGFFEHRWLVDELGGEAVDPGTASLFDPFEHPRSERGQLDLPDRKGLRSYLENVRTQTLAVLEEVDLVSGGRLVEDGFVHDMVVRHEDQHRENMLITLQMFGGPVAGPGSTVRPHEPLFEPPNRRAKPQPSSRPVGMARVPAGTYEVGVDSTVGTYDNEWPAHEVDLDAFEIDRAPVTNGDFVEFIEDGGYGDPTYWSEDGWMIQEALGLEHPKYWTKHDGTWYTREADRIAPVAENQPVVHVSFYEAEAYANWAGKRLPTEHEWEVAASIDPETGAKERFPWGDAAFTPERANLGQRLYGPAPVGSYPEGTSPVGCHQMGGDVWEWTSSRFTGYPGFEAYPYPEYSQEHFAAGYRVLRGGSWATMPSCAQTTFRNWHQPDHQQLFAGFRCARDAS